MRENEIHEMLSELHVGGAIPITFELITQDGAPGIRGSMELIDVHDSTPMIAHMTMPLPADMLDMMEPDLLRACRALAHEMYKHEVDEQLYF